jgi:hypothetical protein
MDRCVKLGIKIKIIAIQTGSLIMELKEWYGSLDKESLHNCISKKVE